MSEPEGHWGSAEDVDDLAALAHEHGYVLALRFMPTGDPEERVFLPVFVEQTHDPNLITLQIFDPTTGEKQAGLMFRADEWERLVSPVDGDADLP